MRSFTIAALVFCATTSGALAQSPADTAYDEYREDIFTLPLGVGVRIPSYDRVNGLSLPWGPIIRIPSGRLEIDPTITYRSNLGKWDPAGRVHVAFSHFDSLDVYAGRGTYTNDAWVRADLINSLASIGVGSDARNYYRGDKVTAELSHSFGKDPWHTSVWIGGSHEFDWSTGIHVKHSDAPWSILNKDDTLKMRRVNPEIAHGHITSITGGVRGKFEQADMKGRFDARIEHAFKAPEAAGDERTFTQAVFDANATFPTFGMQTFAFRGHGVATWDDVSGQSFLGGRGTPPQRFSYLGGAGTLATVDLLALGGDKLVFVEGEYRYPLVRPILPYVGAPVLSARYAAGSAGIDELPDFIQNVGLGLGLKIVKIEYHVDPSYKKTSYTHRHAWSIGFSLSL